MRILTLAISHHTAPVALRESAGFGSYEIADAWHAFRDAFPQVGALLA